MERLFGSISRARILDLLISHAGRSFYQREVRYETGLFLNPFLKSVGSQIEIIPFRRKKEINFDGILNKGSKIKGFKDSRAINNCSRSAERIVKGVRREE